jgi:hypothetical protein
MFSVLFTIITMLVQYGGSNVDAYLFSKSARARGQPIGMAPRFDQSMNKWVPGGAEEDSSAGYGPLGTLLRAGPKPFLQRLVSPEQYDQAVLKYMALDKCSRDEAQGNMDAYLENPMGR